MRESYAIGLAVLLVAGLSGCPLPNEGTNPSGLNSVTLHNSSEHDITFFSVKEDDGQYGRTPGFNLLARPLAPGETFRVDSLEDGEYVFYVAYVTDGGGSAQYVYQSLNGSTNRDWYFNGT